MKRQLPLIIGFLTGLFMFVQFFVPHEAGVTGFNLLNDWVRVIGAFALVLGIASIFQVNWDKIRRRQRDYGYSIVTLVSLLVMVYVGLLRPGEVPLPRGWGVVGAGESLSGVWDRRTGHEAPGAARLHGTSAAAEGAWSNRWPGWEANWGDIAVQPGQRYELTAWAQGQQLTGPGAAVTLSFFDAEHRPVAGGVVAAEPRVVAATWEPLTLAATAPARAAWLQISLGLLGEGTLWFDDVALGGGPPAARRARSSMRGSRRRSATRSCASCWTRRTGRASPGCSTMCWCRWMRRCSRCWPSSWPRQRTGRSGRGRRRPPCC